MRDVIAFILCFALFLFGLFLMGLATTLSAWEGPVFIGGILCIAASFGIPVHFLSRLD